MFSIFEFLTQEFFDLSFNPCIKIRSRVRYIQKKNLVEKIHAKVKGLQNLHNIFVKHKIYDLKPDKKKKLFNKHKELKEFEPLNKKQLQRIKKLAYKLEKIFIINLTIIDRERRELKKFGKEVINKIDKKEAYRIIQELSKETKHVVAALLRQARQIKNGTFSTETIKEFSIQNPAIKLKKIRRGTVRIDTLSKAIKKAMKKSNTNDAWKFYRLKLRNAHIIGHKAGQSFHEIHYILKKTPNNKEIIRKIEDSSKNLVTQTRRAFENIK